MIAIHKRFFAFVVFALAITAMQPTFAQTVTFGSMPIGSGWYVAATTIRNAFERADNGITIDVIAKGGGASNPAVVQQGKADVALSNVATAEWARDGLLLYKNIPAPDIRALIGGLNPVFIGALVRDDFMRKNGYKTLDDIFTSGEPINILVKPRGSIPNAALDIILSAYGMDRDSIKELGGRIIQVDSSQMTDLVKDGKVDILFDSILKGHPTIKEIMLTSNVSFIDLSPRVIKTLSKYHVHKGTIPKWFSNQEHSAVGADFGTEIIANKNMSDDEAYKITKTIIEHMDEISSNYPAWSKFDVNHAADADNTGIKLHPGAKRYYKEIGVLK